MSFVVYNHHSYIEVIATVARKSMNEALEEAKRAPEYTTDGEVCVPCLGHCFYLLHVFVV